MPTRVRNLTLKEFLGGVMTSAGVLFGMLLSQNPALADEAWCVVAIGVAAFLAVVLMLEPRPGERKSGRVRAVGAGSMSATAAVMTVRAPTTGPVTGHLWYYSAVFAAAFLGAVLVVMELRRNRAYALGGASGPKLRWSLRLPPSVVVGLVLTAGAITVGMALPTGAPARLQTWFLVTIALIALIGFGLLAFSAARDGRATPVEPDRAAARDRPRLLANVEVIAGWLFCSGAVVIAVVAPPTGPWPDQALAYAVLFLLPFVGVYLIVGGALVGRRLTDRQLRLGPADGSPRIRWIGRIKLTVAGLMAGGVVLLGATLPHGAPAQQEIPSVLAVIAGILLTTRLVISLLDRGHRTGPANQTTGVPGHGRRRFRRRIAATVRRFGMSLLSWLPRRRRPQLLPPRQSAFRGRADELARLEHEHRNEMGRPPSRLRFVDRRRRRARPDSAGPFLVLLHGRPGVGKSALGQELAHRLTRWYPDGALYANLGAAGNPRSAGEVLRRFLLALGWPDGEVPDQTADRARLFRSLTARRRVLVVLDAARDLDQVVDLLPSGPYCSVIVTSRRDLGPVLSTRSHLIDVPDIAQALELLYAAALMPRPEHAECAVAIVERCGRLPAALRSAGDRMTEDRMHLCSVADMLRSPATRLGLLSKPGRNIDERIESEYLRLAPEERRVFRLLALVHTETFLPWVATALAGLSVSAAEETFAQLSAAHLLEHDRPDPVTALVRYRMSPLVRLFAEARLAQSGDTGQAVAIDRLEQAYLAAAHAVLVRVDPEYAGLGLPAPETPVYLGRADIVQAIADKPEQWIRAEYANLVRVVHLAFQQERWQLCWRVAVRLGTCVSEPFDAEHGKQAERAFARGLAAAEKVPTPFPVIQVLLARARLETSLEIYDRAFGTLRDAYTRARQYDARRSNPVEAALLRVTALRQIGNAYLQMGARERAGTCLDEAHWEAVSWRAEYRSAYSDAQSTAMRLEEREIALLRAETHGFDSATAPELAQSSDSHSFRANLVMAENARQRQLWDRATHHLGRALQLSKQDSRRMANTQYRLARLALDRHYVELSNTGWFVPNGRGPAEAAADTGIIHAVLAMRLFAAMGNRPGVLRARCLLVRTLAAANRLPEAEVHLVRAKELMNAIPDQEGNLRPALMARLQRADGEFCLQQSRTKRRTQLRDRAHLRLTTAAQLFDTVGDWRMRDDTLRLRDGGGHYPTLAGQSWSDTDEPWGAAEPGTPPAPAQAAPKHGRRRMSAIVKLLRRGRRQTPVPEPR